MVKRLWLSNIIQRPSASFQHPVFADCSQHEHGTQMYSTYTTWPPFWLLAGIVHISRAEWVEKNSGVAILYLEQKSGVILTSTEPNILRMLSYSKFEWAENVAVQACTKKLLYDQLVSLKAR